MGANLDIAVAGCGIAGMAAAVLVARDGHRPTLFERFETPAPLGSGLMIQPTGLAVLHELGLAEQLLRSGQRIDRLHGVAAGRVVLDVRYEHLRKRNCFGVGVHRSTLFDLLHSAVNAEEIPISPGRRVVGAQVDGGGARLKFDDGTSEGPFDLIVDALGTWSPLAAQVGAHLPYGALWANVVGPGPDFDSHALSQRYRRASIMAGILPIGQGQAAFFWSLRRDRYPAWVDAGVDSWKGEVRQLWPGIMPMVDQIQSSADLTFARYAHKTVKKPVGERLISIGDSWHSASPQLGQGANMALLDAIALSRGCGWAGRWASGWPRP